MINIYFLIYLIFKYKFNSPISSKFFNQFKSIFQKTEEIHPLPIYVFMKSRLLLLNFRSRINQIFILFQQNEFRHLWCQTRMKNLKIRVHFSIENCLNIMLTSLYDYFIFQINIDFISSLLYHDHYYYYSLRLFYNLPLLYINYYY